MERNIETISLGKAMRIRIGMYLSAEPSEALQLALREIYVNSLDALIETNQSKGHIDIIIDSNKRTVIVKDDGPGISNKVRDDGVHSVVAAYTLGHSGSHFSESQNTNAIGLNGVGAKVVCHTAETFQITNSDKNTKVIALFNGTDDGAELINFVETQSKEHGVNIVYTPDKKVYGDAWFNETALIDEFSEMMKFYPKYSLTLNFDNRKNDFYFPNGLKLNNTKIYYESENFILSLGVGEGQILPFGNRLYLPNGGNFMTHLRTQMTKIVNDLSGLKLTGAQIQSVFNGYAAIFVKSPLFSNQSKTAISNKEVNQEITLALKDGLEEFSLTPEWDKVIKRLEAEMKAEAAAEKARQKVLQAKKDYQNKKINSMSDKFIDSDWKKRDECALFLAEGDSAGGPIKRTKDNKDAVMLLRGKVLNTAKESFDKVVENQELLMISKGLGATLTEDGFLLAERNMRFGKIIIATDSDPDGSHISSLLMTFFYEYYPNIIKKGMLYSLAPKLFKITHNGKDVYFGNEAELQAYLKANKLKNPNVNRYKGLGSFDDDEFKSQVAPATRSLIQITMNDAKRAAESMKLMEQDVDARKELIYGEWELGEEE